MPFWTVRAFLLRFINTVVFSFIIIATATAILTGTTTMIMVVFVIFLGWCRGPKVSGVAILHFQGFRIPRLGSQDVSGFRPSGCRVLSVWGLEVSG